MKSPIPDKTTHLDVPLHTLKVESDSLLVKVAVLLNFQSGILGDGDVVSPGRSRHVQSLGTWEESGQEGGSDPQSTSTGNGLGDG